MWIVWAVHVGPAIWIVWAIWIGVLVVGLVIAGIFALLQHPTLIPLVIYLFIGLLLLIAAVVAVRKVIGVIRARIGQRRARETLSEVHRLTREYLRYSLQLSGGDQDEEMRARELEEKTMQFTLTEEYRRQSYYKEAVAAYRIALFRNPSDGNAFRGMGNALFALERYDEALNAFQQAIELDPISATYAGLGNVFARLQRYDEAVVAYEKAIKLDPTVTLNYDDFIRSLRALGRKEEAEQVHAMAVQLGYEDEE